MHHTFSFGRQAAKLTVIFLFAFISGCIVGCSKPSATAGAGADEPSVGDLSGNWVFGLAPPTSNGAEPYVVAGSIFEELGGSSIHFVTSILSVAGPCFGGASIVPLLGTISGSRLQISSFDVDGRTLSFDVNSDAAGDELNGSYQLNGTCQASGSLTATKYLPLSGSFLGNFTGTVTGKLSLRVSQAASETAAGTFLLSGTADVAPSLCFAAPALEGTESFVRGNVMQLYITTGDPSQSTLILRGTFNQSASTITVTSATITGGVCAGPLQPFTLNKM